MTPRIRIAATLLLASLTATAEVPEIDALLAGFAQPAPARTAYFERRDSPLLTQPLLFGGELSQPAADELVKTVEGAQPERLRIAGERVEVQREGQGTRRFSLKRAPELGALAASLRALLGGDRGLLERHFAIELTPSGAGWTLDLTPTDARVARKVRGMRLHGVAGEWRCFDLDLAEDERSRMWLGPWAESARAAADEVTRDALCGTAAE
ncbi:MAG: outer membrane lipoprotein carrier protein LolA [Xanthomonadales bacterium]|nr:outer membrane lipoprotein carrier protein LolA [Xanthomonadales bacterium]